MSRPKTRMRDDSGFSDLLFKSTFSHNFVFNLPSIRDIKREHPGSFDMRAPIPLNVVPRLTQASCKSAQIGEPELHMGHDLAVNHRWDGGGDPAENIPHKRLQVHTKVSKMQHCQSDMYSLEKDKRNYFYKLFLTCGEAH